MTLFSSLYVGASAIHANQFALQVVGNNIANAGSEGYVRQEAVFGTLDSVRAGALTFGAGARTVAIRQQIDRQLNERARQAGGEVEAADAQASLFRRVEVVFNELTDQDLSSALGNFFDALQNVANRPDDVALRAIAVENARVATGLVRDLRTQIDRLVADVNREVSLAPPQINEMLETVRRLNTAVVQAEAGSPSDAGDLRTERDRVLRDLTKLIDVQVYEQPNGAVNILTDGDYLLFNGTIQRVGYVQKTVDGQPVAQLVFEHSQTPLQTRGGRIGGVQQFRDDLLPDVTRALDDLAKGLIFGFNQIHSGGQGLENFRSLEGAYRAIDPAAPMNSPDAGLAFTPKNGGFQILVTDRTTGQIRTYDVAVDLNGLGADDSLVDVANRINAVAFGGQTVAVVNAQGRLELNAPPDQSFAFANDTSGFLAAFGLNAFFDGLDSRSIRVNPLVAANPALLAASSNGQPGDNGNVLKLALFGETPSPEFQGRSLSEYFASVVQQLGAASRSATLRAETLKTTKAALESESLSISGVSLDEEAIKLIAFQRAFQASARFLQTISQMMDELMNVLR